MEKDLAIRYLRNPNTIFHKEIDSMPLLIEITTSTMTMVAKAIAVKKERLSATLFQVPTDFKEVKGMQ